MINGSNDMEQLNDCTIMLVERLEDYKNNIIKNKFKGYDSLVKGVDIIIDILKCINPVVFDMCTFSLVDKYKELGLVNVGARYHKIDGYVHMGIDNSMMILWGYVSNKTLKRER